MSTFNKADILLPKTADLSKWSVVACDQYTSQPEYWNSADELVGDAPSTLRLVFPEVFLDEGDKRIAKINAAMSEYLESGIFTEYKNSIFYIERTVSTGVRQGIIGAVDLEDYDYSKGSSSKIRATEGTVLERIPPRVKIRCDALLELPHVMLLIDDEEKSVIEPLEACDKELLYDFELMKDGGRIKGFRLSDSEADKLLARIDTLDAGKKGNLLFAVGDGNHSLATAKSCWETLKPTLSEEERKTHPARFCLVEIVNIHSPALEFEPIHRVIFGVDEDAFLAELKAEYNASETDNGGQHIIWTSNGKSGDIYITDAPSNLAVGTLQKFLDKNQVETDYIHGDDVVAELSAKTSNLGFLLPAMAKSELFETVIADGALPRKTFSMDHAHEKRFYTEAKKIK